MIIGCHLVYIFYSVNYFLFLCTIIIFEIIIFAMFFRDVHPGVIQILIDHFPDFRFQRTLILDEWIVNIRLSLNPLLCFFRISTFKISIRILYFNLRDVVRARVLIHHRTPWGKFFWVFDIRPIRCGYWPKCQWTISLFN